MTDRTPLERRLRRVVVGLAMLCALLVLVLVIAGVLVYWKLYLLSPSADPFSRGPFVIRLGETSAELAWTLPGHGRVDLVATAPDGTSVAGRDGRFVGLEPGVRYLWTASIGGVGKAAGSFRAGPRDLTSPITFAVIGDYGSGSDHEWAVGRTLAAEQPDSVVTAGDNSYLVGAPVRPAQIAYARRELARPGPLVRFVVLHRPVQPGDALLILLRKYHVAAILAGHLHRYERRVVGGVSEFVVGTSGEGPGAG
jgi:hypothetical protein